MRDHNSALGIEDPGFDNIAVHADRIAEGLPPCHVLLNLNGAPSHALEFCCRYDTERVCRPRPKACGGSCPLKAPVASLCQRFGLCVPRNVRCVYNM